MIEQKTTLKNQAEQILKEEISSLVKIENGTHNFICVFFCTNDQTLRTVLIPRWAINNNSTLWAQRPANTFADYYRFWQTFGYVEEDIEYFKLFELTNLTPNVSGDLLQKYSLDGLRFFTKRGTQRVNRVFSRGVKPLVDKLDYKGSILKEIRSASFPVFSGPSIDPMNNIDCTGN